MRSIFYGWITLGVMIFLSACSSGGGSSTTAPGPTPTVVYSFAGCPSTGCVSGSDGKEPDAILIQDSAGNLYGTTLFGGTSANCSKGCGTVFKLTPSSQGDLYTETVLYSFEGSDGAYPQATLIQDSAGNLYGMTSYGGRGANCNLGCGTVFELTPPTSPGRPYTETVLYYFDGTGSDGALPGGGLITDSAGDLYGTTYEGGASDVGTVFKLSPSSPATDSSPAVGPYTETVLYSFAGGNDGRGPSAGLTQDSAGDLYGTTYEGGASDVGTVFRLMPSSPATDSSPAVGPYTETVLHSFAGCPSAGCGSGSDGKQPEASLIQDSAGNLYGTTYDGGTSDNGTVFKLTPSSPATDSSPAVGPYTETVLYSFAGCPSAGCGSGSDGTQPMASLIQDSAGNLYGTTYFGGAIGDGTVFRLTPSLPATDSSPAVGPYTETVLYSFAGGIDGWGPSAGLTQDTLGNVYGTTLHGGKDGNNGTVFEFVP